MTNKTKDIIEEIGEMKIATFGLKEKLKDFPDVMVALEKALQKDRAELVKRVEEVLRNRVLDITDEYKGKKFEKGIQVYLGYPKLLIEDLIKIIK